MKRWAPYLLVAALAAALAWSIARRPEAAYSPEPLSPRAPVPGVTQRVQLILLTYEPEGTRGQTIAYVDLAADGRIVRFDGDRPETSRWARELLEYLDRTP